MIDPFSHLAQKYITYRKQFVGLYEIKYIYINRSYIYYNIIYILTYMQFPGQIYTPGDPFNV